MSVLTIRAHKRFAVCRNARLRSGEKGGSGRAVEGLLIELSLEGCRLSKIATARFNADQIVSFHIDGAEPIAARVRWLGEGTIGLRFVEPLHLAALARLIHICREPVPVLVPGAAAAIIPSNENERAYGT